MAIGATGKLEIANSHLARVRRAVKEPPALVAEEVARSLGTYVSEVEGLIAGRRGT